MSWSYVVFISVSDWLTAATEEGLQYSERFRYSWLSDSISEDPMCYRTITAEPNLTSFECTDTSVQFLIHEWTTIGFSNKLYFNSFLHFAVHILTTWDLGIKLTVLCKDLNARPSRKFDDSVLSPVAPLCIVCLTLSPHGNPTVSISMWPPGGTSADDQCYHRPSKQLQAVFNVKSPHIALLPRVRDSLLLQLGGESQWAASPWRL